MTRDGVEIRLEANLELPVELDQALANGAMGLGLVRTEFLFLNRDDLPDEDEQYEFYAGLVRGMGGRPVTLRTLDAGGDKLPEALAAAGGDAADPALGLRGIRLSLKERRLFDIQLAAMLRAAREGPLRILLPMISTVGEIRRTREAIEQVSRRLRRRGVAFAEVTPPLGVMIEVPGAALAADALAARPISSRSAPTTSSSTRWRSTAATSRSRISTTRCIRACCGSSSSRSRPAAPAHPVGICGEMAGEPRYAALLLGLGLARAVDVAGQPAAPQAAHPQPRHDRRDPPRRGDHGPVRFRPHRRPARRFQRDGATRLRFLQLSDGAPSVIHLFASLLTGGAPPVIVLLSMVLSLQNIVSVLKASRVSRKRRLFLLEINRRPSPTRNAVCRRRQPTNRVRISSRP